ncbi:MAG: hypothetical protein AAF587_42530 [Bacteroidota bacterium]
MQQSIENIWKEGFLKEDALIAPKLNNLFDQKSIHVVDTFKRRFRINIILVAIGSLAIGGGFALAGVPVLATCMCLMLAMIAFIGRKELDKLEDLELGVSSYEYLQAFNTWLKDMISLFGTVYRFWYPCFILIFGLAMFVANTDNGWYDLMNRDSLAVMLPMGLLAVVMSLFSKQVFEWDLKTIYGGLITKLEELLADFEELQA